jgi:hypothetical protein
MVWDPPRADVGGVRPLWFDQLCRSH